MFAAIRMHPAIRPGPRWLLRWSLPQEWVHRHRTERTGVADEVAQEDEAVVKVGILAQQLLDHIRLIGDQVVHADAQQFAGILFAVDGPCGDRLAALMDLLHHTGGDKRWTVR